MSVMTHQAGGGGAVERAPGGGSSSLADVVALILDKGLVIDLFIRVSHVDRDLDYRCPNRRRQRRYLHRLRPESVLITAALVGE